MVDYENSSQLNQWLFPSRHELSLCRAQANRNAREFIVKRMQQSDDTESTTIVTPQHFAAAWNILATTIDSATAEEPPQTTTPDAFLTPDEETILIDFYAHKLPSLIGPQALRLRRDPKVTATAALLYRRFFLSNSVLLFDPKVVMVAAAFLASKVEDATVDIRQLEEGTALMNAPVFTQDIIPTEVALLEGLHFQLRCFHPYKAVVALTEDLRTFLKTKAGQALFVRLGGDANNSNHLISGQDLIPIYERARSIVDRAIVSDIPLLYAPGQVGLAALMLAQQQQSSDNVQLLQMDLMGYLKVRFPDQNVSTMEPILQHLCDMLAELESEPEEQQHMLTLKAIHKKLKKVRVWGKNKKDNGDGESKKKRKREE